MNDTQLRHAYEQLMQRRSHQDAPPAVSLEVIQELAQVRRVPDDRLELLDTILAHPVTRDEFYFLRGLAQSRPAARPVSRVAVWAIAAALLLAVGISTVQRFPGRAQPEPMRGGVATIELAAPLPGASLSRSTRFAWHPMAGAARYTIDLVGPGGDVIWSAVTPETTAVVPPNVPLGSSARHVWMVRAAMSDGTTLRSTARPLDGAR